MHYRKVNQWAGWTGLRASGMTIAGVRTYQYTRHLACLTLVQQGVVLECTLRAGPVGTLCRVCGSCNIRKQFAVSHSVAFPQQNSICKLLYLLTGIFSNGNGTTDKLGSTVSLPSMFLWQLLQIYHLEPRHLQCAGTCSFLHLYVYNSLTK